ncbi:MAG: rhomboid family intramembrane serine protease [Parabacteroides sp.]|nr:rhomboid family intramembrane serine protease [Parabacteroides sp.]
MATGFKPKYEQVIQQEGYSSDELMFLAVNAAKYLGWQIGCVKRDKLEFYTSVSMKSWEEKVIISRIEGKEGCLLAKSECTSVQFFDWGKNKENLEKLISAIDTVDRERKNNSEDFITYNFSDDKEISEYDGNDMSFLSLITLRKGNIATPLLIYINVALFIIMSICGVSFIEPTGISLIKWGANFGPLTLTGDWWRTVTCNFIHIGIIHILMNMYALLYIGIFLEQFIGSRKLIIAYFLTGLFSALLSLMIHPEIISAGASGSIFGLYGIFLSYLLFNHRIDKHQRKSLLYSIGFFVVYNLLLGAGKEGIDNAAHIGGLISGAILGIIYLLADKYESKRISQYITHITEIIFLIVFVFIFAGQTKNIPSDFEEIRNMWEDGTLEEYAQSFSSEEEMQEGGANDNFYMPHEEDNSANFTGSDESIGNGKREYVNKACGLRCTYPEGWKAVRKSDNKRVLQLMGNTVNSIVFNYDKFSSAEEIDNTRNLLLKSMNGFKPERVNINGTEFEKISGIMEYPVAGGGSININQSIIFHMNKKTLDGFIIISMTANETHESEARDIIASIRINH